MAVISLAACKPKAGDGDASAEAVDPVKVSATPAREQSMPVTATFTGTLRADREARVAAAAAGRLLKLHIERGAVVKAGQVLAELDTSSASLSAAEAAKSAQTAKVQRELAKKDCERAKTLFEGGAISKSSYDAQKAQCESAELGVETAGLRASMGAQMVRDATVRAPFAGVIETRDSEVGEYLMPGSQIATLVSTEKLRLEVLVPEAQLSHVSMGEAVSFRVSAHKDRVFSAKVSLIGAVVRQGTRDVLVEAAVDNSDGALKPGMFTTVEIVTAEAPSPVVPKSSLVAKGDASHLFVVVDGRAHQRLVKVGAEKGDDVAITRGVAVGDRVINRPAEAVRNGAPVTEGE